MHYALLQTLVNDPSGGQIAGGVMMIVLFLSVGVAAAGAFAFVARHVFLGRYERMFWSALLVVIAAFYLGFAAWYQADAVAWRTELAAITVFAFVAVIGASSAPVLALGYLFHGVWDIAHSLYGVIILGFPASEIPLGYGMFCLGFDVATAAYLFWWPKDWNTAGQFNPIFWAKRRR
ncbi:MAG: hypothetical protein EVA65_04650 [Oceanococcus sp.]|nr:MAG: hypothetical protein EVA65_04650 [Oceanococcus sp.]